MTASAVPCVVCGATGFSPSFGGPNICPACDVGDSVDGMRRTIASQAADIERLKVKHEAYRQFAIVAFYAKDAEIAALKQWQREMVEIQASGGRLDGYREMGAQIAAQAAEIERLSAHIERGHEIHECLTNFSSHSMEWDMALDEAIAYLSPHAKSKAIDAIEP